MREKKGHGRQDETPGAERCRGAAATLRDCCDSLRVGRGWSRVAPFLPINSFVSVVFFWGGNVSIEVLKSQVVGGEKNTLLKAGNGSVLNNRNVCSPKQRGETDGCNG